MEKFDKILEPFNPQLTLEDRAMKLAIRGLRKRTGMTQETFGRQFKVTKRTVKRWESFSDITLPNSTNWDRIRVMIEANAAAQKISKVLAGLAGAKEQ